MCATATSFELSAPPSDAAALTEMVELGAAAAGEDQRRLVEVASLECTWGQLRKVHDELAGRPVSVAVGDVAVDAPSGPVRERFRHGAGAEAAYHAFCERHDFELVSADGAVWADGTCGWAWVATPQRWAAGCSSTDGRSYDVECVAAAEALEANLGRRVALTSDCLSVLRLVTGAAVPVAPAAQRLVAAAQRQRSCGELVVFHLSSSSSSKRQHWVDNLSGWAAQAAAAGHDGPWGHGCPLPEMPRTRNRHYPG
jgi:hypothetical protein